MKNTISHVGIIGYGNVGSHLSRIFHRTEGIDLIVFNRSRISRNQNPDDIAITQRLADLSSCDLVLLTVKDDALIPVLGQMEGVFSKNTIVCHCSGSTPSTVIAPYFANYGVMYPLQTFSREKSIDYTKIPIFITGSNPSSLKLVKEISQYISPKINQVNDDQRIALHISAVFCCNYTNAMYAIGAKICTDHNLDFDHLHPLIEETADKIKSLSPQEAQTGPAIRGDWKTVERQESYLAGYDSKMTTLYRQLADYINQNS